MDETVRSILIALGTILASLIASWAVQIRGRADTQKDAEKVRLAQLAVRNESEKAFRDAFAEIKRDFDEERRKNERLDKRIDELVDLRTKDAGELALLRGEIVQLKKDAEQTAKDTANLIRGFEEKLLLRTNERDEALAKVIVLNGEVHKRDEQIASLQKALDEMRETQDAMQEQIRTLQELQKKGTGSLSPDGVPDVPPDSKAQTAIDAVAAALADTPPEHDNPSPEVKPNTSVE